MKRLNVLRLIVFGAIVVLGHGVGALASNVG